ncbi:MAG TPA: type II secretion system protein M [Gammaproteobacteria bacterium]|nr:type II secretion system protein M [Gammaproteobacteria bacterium]
MSRIDELKAWYVSLQQRERLVLAIGAAFVVVMLVYAVLLRPYFSSLHALKDDIERQQTQLVSMRQLSVQIQAMRGQQPSSLPRDQSLLAVVDRSASEAGFGTALKQVQTNSDGTVHLQLQAASFDKLMRWLGDLHRQYGISVQQLIAQRGTGPGSVDANLTLQAPAS